MDTNVRIYDFPRDYKKVVVSVEYALESKGVRKQPLYIRASANEYNTAIDNLVQRFQPISRLDMTARIWLIYPRTMLEQITDALNFSTLGIAMAEVA